MKGPGNAKYTSNTIQNEILQCLADMVHDTIVKEVKSEVFSVIADESKDLQKKEQLSLVVRYYYNGEVHESFLCFQHAEQLDAKSLSEMVIGCLESYGLEYKSNLIGQGYDGATDISTENHRDRSIDARGLLAQIDLTFISLLATFRKLFGNTKLLSDLLQSPSVDLAIWQ
uniref:DUF4371 domain-containing protein n=1 Tax=Nothobranchius pienaari TaxID=704102 RepID=A0A1A8LDK7_9TELE